MHGVNSNYRIKEDVNKVQLTMDTVSLSIVSAGSYSGSIVLLPKMEETCFSNSFFQGIGVVVFDEKTLEVDTTAWFEIFNNATGAKLLPN